MDLKYLLEKITLGFPEHMYHSQTKGVEQTTQPLRVHVNVDDLNADNVVLDASREGAWETPTFKGVAFKAHGGRYALFVDPDLRPGEVVLKLNTPWPTSEQY